MSLTRGQYFVTIMLHCGGRGKSVMNLRWILGACAIGACLGFGAPANASPLPYNPITWLVTGTFDDGGTLSGSFSFDGYGYLQSADITTTPGVTLPGQTYIWPVGSFANIIPGSPPPDGIDLFVGYNQVLQLVFNNSLETPGIDPLNVTDVSFECVSFSCPPGGTDFVNTRYFTAGVATSPLTALATPLPSTWTMLIAGFIGLGFFAYRGLKEDDGAFAAA
jgi:hypothetical protein